MFGEQSDFFHKVVRQSAGPHDLKFFLLSTQNMKRKRFQGSYEKIATLVLLPFRSTTNIRGESI